MKNHPARSARFLAGWAGLAGIIITGAAVLEDATVSVDYTGLSDLLNTAPVNAIEPFDLTGEATTPSTEVIDTVPEQGVDPASPVITTTTVAPNTTTTTKPRRAKSKAS